ncbi:MAG: two-component system chemotaxis response regulator CheY [Myxococcota bacterium]|jgi:two-component system chemotaxis response regulator CheY
MKVLIVDDSRAMRMIVKRTLRQAGFNSLDIVEAVDGQDALEKIKAKRPQLILSDWNMPNLDGYKLLEALRSSGEKIPFGFVTAQGTPEMQQRARSAGASFFITKPITVDDFRKKLGSYIP